jgi:two-component system sensor histidine kinase BaeS
MDWDISLKGELVMKLGQKLFLIFILTSALVISMTGYMTLKGTRNLFDRYLKENMYYRAQQWSEAFGEYYKAYDSWNGVEQLLYIGQRGRGRGFGIGTRWEHVILTDNDGYIVASSAGFEPDLRIELLEMNRGVPVTVDGKTVGFVFLETPQSAGVVSIEQQFISAVRRNMFISIAVSALMAVILGALSASKITKPLKQLSHAAYEMASGDLSVRVKVDGRDEIAETAQSFNNMAYNLQKSINLRNALTADVAHELRTPLTIIRGTSNQFRKVY